ncbi:MAG: serine hydrolase domain-containing protein [Pseudomonadota bacterium]
MSTRIAGIAFLLAGTVQLVAAQQSEIERRLDTVMGAWQQTGRPGAAVAYIDRGELVISKAYGIANLEHQIPWATSTVSDLGSVSKQFTGFAFALLAEQDLLNLDDDIRQYLPELPDLGETVTLRHLLNHTSGLREVYSTLYMVNRRPGDIIYQEDAQKLVSYQTKLQFPPGSRYLYNNTEYMLLADVVEAVSGVEFHEWMDVNIFKPLGMSDTQVMHEQGQVIVNVATSYGLSGEHFVQIYDNSTLQGGGGIYSTVQDVSKWMLNFASLQVGSETTLELLTTPGQLNSGELLDYGLGIDLALEGDVEVWSHAGASAGYRSQLVYVPEHERGFIFLTNTPANGVPVDELTAALLGDVVPASQPESEVSKSVPEQEAVPLKNPDAYAGRYFSDELESFYRVSLQEGKLVLSHRWLGAFTMRHLGGAVFDFEDRGGSLQFAQEKTGEVSGFVFDDGRTLGVEFRRLP